jgi:hypothetical protein
MLKKTSPANCVAMYWHIVLGLLIFMAVVIGLEYLIRHALMKGPEQWKWDQWDWITVGIVVFLGLILALFIACKSKYRMPMTSYEMSSPLGSSRGQLLSSPMATPYPQQELITPISTSPLLTTPRLSTTPQFTPVIPSPPPPTPLETTSALSPLSAPA